MNANAATSPRRPGSVRLLLGVLAFLGITALGGGIEMVAFHTGNDYLPLELLDGVPVVDSFLLPGLVLALVFGVGSCVAGVGIWTRRPVAWLGGVGRRTGRHWSWGLTVVLGVGFAAWMVLEWLWLGVPWAGETLEAQLTTWILYGIYDLVAVALVVLPQTRGVRTHLAVPPTPPMSEPDQPPGNPGHDDRAAPGQAVPRAPVSATMSTSPTVRRSAVQLPMTPPPRRTRCPTAPGNRAHWRAVASPEQVLRAWVLALALGEVLGFVAPAVTGVALVSAGVSDPWLVVGLTVAGLVEGLAIGWFGARVLGRD